MDEDWEEDRVVESVGLGCSLDRFSEWKEILEMVESLTASTPPGQDEEETKRAAEKTYERFKYVVNQYKEQPHLLDSNLEAIVNKLIGIVRNDDISEGAKHRAFQFMHLLINVRGYKMVVQKLPHEAADLEPVLSYLEKQDETDVLTWEVRYCLILWMSIIVKIPFHMGRLDPYEYGPDYKPVMERLFEIVKKYLLVGDICRNGASYLSAHFFTRSDTKVTLLPRFFSWVSELVRAGPTGNKHLGPLSATASILKIGKREDMLPFADNLLETMLAFKWSSQPYRLSRKYAVKIIQRIGLTYLRPRVLTWRYQRGSRTLPEDVSNWSSGDKTEQLFDNALLKPDEEEEFEVPSQIEEVVEELMHGLRDPDISVRWSAAKGVGRVMGRMSRTLGDDIVGCILELLTPRESDSGWHGGCLALAELSKRGLLLPSRLPTVMPLVEKALVYDEPRGYASVGSHIRDAACYVSWTFARAYDSTVLKPYVVGLANALVIVSCFDREINVRRAASAAFQEHIGRQGTFPHGLEILTAADYFAVGIRNNAYLTISVFIAQFDEYTTHLIDHLVDRKSEHWDIAIRNLTAKALHNLTPKAPHYMIEIALPTLMQKTTSIDANVRHGAIISVADIIHALSIENMADIGEPILYSVKDLVKTLRRQLKDLNAELMKIACCHLIYKCSLSKLPFHNQPVLDEWQQLIDECISHEVANIRSQAAQALAALCSEYYQKDNQPMRDKCNNILDKYTTSLKNHELSRVGQATALGSLPKMVLEGDLKSVISTLIGCATITKDTEKWVDSRRYSIKSLTTICTVLGVDDCESSCKPFIKDIFECFLTGLNDYTKDNRGDTGAWVREACMTGLQTLIIQCTSSAPELLNPSIVSRAMCGIAQQAVERIDRTRALAGTVFSTILHHEPKVPHIPRLGELERIFPQEACKTEINWLSETSTFPKFTELLGLEEYTHGILTGLIVSVGGLTERLVKTSSTCFFDYLKTQPLPEIHRLCKIVVQIYEENINDNRIVLPMLSFLEMLLSSSTIHPVLNDPESEFAQSIFNLTKQACVGSLEKFKLIGSVAVYCQLIQAQGISKKVLSRLMILLCHKFAWLRKTTASKLYESLMLYGDELDLSEEDLESAQNLLSDTEWSAMKLEEIKPIRNELASFLNIPPPLTVTKT